MSYSPETKKHAMELRKKGVSIIQLAKKFNIAKSTASLWVRDIELPPELRKYLTKNSVLGREKGLQIMKAKREIQRNKNYEDAHKLISQFSLKDRNFARLCCAMIFWCEGSKRQLSSLCFTNSDPRLIKLFLTTLRNGFDINEKKLRCLMHLHTYHNEKEQLDYWSKVTNIPLSQFNKSYLKPNTQIRKRENYQGCIAINYFDSSVARKLDAIYHTFAETIGP